MLLFPFNTAERFFRIRRQVKQPLLHHFKKGGCHMAKRNLLELYNAMTGKHYTDPGLLKVNTLKNAIYFWKSTDRRQRK